MAYKTKVLTDEELKEKKKEMEKVINAYNREVKKNKAQKKRESEKRARKRRLRIQREYRKKMKKVRAKLKRQKEKEEYESKIKRLQELAPGYYTVTSFHKENPGLYVWLMKHGVNVKQYLPKKTKKFRFHARLNKGINCYHYKTKKLYKHYNFVAEACRDLELSYYWIYRVLDGRIPCVDGYYFKYANEQAQKTADEINAKIIGRINAIKNSKHKTDGTTKGENEETSTE
jgi:phage-related minor tail protein